MAYDSKSFSNTIADLKQSVTASNTEQSADLSSVNRNTDSMSKSLEKMTEQQVIHVGIAKGTALALTDNTAKFTSMTNSIQKSVDASFESMKDNILPGSGVIIDQPKGAKDVEDRRDKDKKESRLEKMTKSMNESLKSMKDSMLKTAKGGLIAALSAVGFMALIKLFQSKTWKTIASGIADIMNWLVNDAGSFTKWAVVFGAITLAFKPLRTLSAVVIGKLGKVLLNFSTMIWAMIKGGKGFGAAATAAGAMGGMGMGMGMGNRPGAQPGGRGGGGMYPMPFGQGMGQPGAQPGTQPGSKRRGRFSRMRQKMPKMPPGAGKGIGGLLNLLMIGGIGLSMFGGDDEETDGKQRKRTFDEQLGSQYTPDMGNYGKVDLMPSTLETLGGVAALGSTAALAKGAMKPKVDKLPKGGGKPTRRIPTPRAGGTPKTGSSSGSTKVADKFAHLRKFPMLYKLRGFPILSAVLGSVQAVAILSDPKMSTKQKIRKMGALVGAMVGAAGMAKLGGLAGVVGGPVGIAAGVVVGSFAGWFGGEWAGTKLMGILMADEDLDYKDIHKGVPMGGTTPPTMPKVPATDKPRTGVMTKSGFKKLTKSEIEEGMQSGDIKKNLGKLALSKMQMKAGSSANPIGSVKWTMPESYSGTMGLMHDWKGPTDMTDPDYMAELTKRLEAKGKKYPLAGEKKKEKKKDGPLFSKYLLKGKGTDDGSAAALGKKLVAQEKKQVLLKSKAEEAEKLQKEKREAFLKEWNMEFVKGFDGTQREFRGKNTKWDKKLGKMVGEGKEGWKEAAMKSGLFYETKGKGRSAGKLRAVSTQATRDVYAHEDKKKDTERRLSIVAAGGDVTKQLHVDALGFEGDKSFSHGTHMKLAKLEEQGQDISRLRTKSGAADAGLVKIAFDEWIADKYLNAERYMPAHDGTSHPRKDKKNLETAENQFTANDALVDSWEPGASLGVNIHNFEDFKKSGLWSGGALKQESGRKWKQVGDNKYARRTDYAGGGHKISDSRGTTYYDKEGTKVSNWSTPIGGLSIRRYYDKEGNVVSGTREYRGKVSGMKVRTSDTLSPEGLANYNARLEGRQIPFPEAEEISKDAASNVKVSSMGIHIAAGKNKQGLHNFSAQYGGGPEGFGYGAGTEKSRQNKNMFKFGMQELASGGLAKKVTMARGERSTELDFSNIKTQAAADAAIKGGFAAVLTGDELQQMQKRRAEDVQAYNQIGSPTVNTVTDNSSKQSVTNISSNTSKTTDNRMNSLAMQMDGYR